MRLRILLLLLQERWVLLVVGYLHPYFLRQRDGLVLLVVEGHHYGLTLALDVLSADIQCTLAESETLVPQTSNGCLYDDFVGIEDRGKEVGTYVCHHNGHLLKDIAAYYVKEVLCLAHVKEREIDRIIDVAERIYIGETKLCRHLMPKGEVLGKGVFHRANVE